jgi:chromosome segregation ATPase
LKTLDKKIQDAEKTAKGLDKDINDMEKINEKAKNEVFQNQKLLHNEINKNQEMNSRILNLENVLKSRDNQIQDASQDLGALRSENSEIYEENNKLNYDLDALKKHIELINYLNTQIIDELEKFSEQDEAVRALLNRKSRIKDLRMKAESTSKKTVMRVTEVTKKVVSPVKKSPMKTIKKVPEYSKY